MDQLVPPSAPITRVSIWCAGHSNGDVSRVQSETRMRLPITSTAGHEGSPLVLDNARELLSIVSPSGEILGTVRWASVIDLVQNQREAGRDGAPVQSMVPLALKVHSHAAGALAGEGLTVEFGRGGFSWKPALRCPSEPS